MKRLDYALEAFLLAQRNAKTEANTKQEKFNLALSEGLANLTGGIQDLQAKIDWIEEKIIEFTKG